MEVRYPQYNDIWFFMAILAWVLYSMITSQVGDRDLIVQIAGVGDMSLKTFLKDRFGFEHEFLPSVADVHIG